MFKTYEIMRELGLSSAPNQTQLARYLLSKPLEFDPGTWQQYSNFGYMLLGMIIEQATGEDYERYMQETIFEPNGCFGFSMARDYTVRILGGGGGWVGSAPELARMVATIDGRGPIADILSEESLKRMAIQGGIDAYPLGWMDSRDGTLTRTGTLAGASLLIKLYPDGTCWIMISNTTTSRRSYFTKDMAELFLQLRGPYNGLFPARDLFSGHSGR
jgi:CubicO group peptidase (beta-lactamase class C family)